MDEKNEENVCIGRGGGGGIGRGTGGGGEEQQEERRLTRGQVEGRGRRPR